MALAPTSIVSLVPQPVVNTTKFKLAEVGLPLDNLILLLFLSDFKPQLNHQLKL